MLVSPLKKILAKDWANFHVREIADDQCVVVGIVAHQADRVAAGAGWRNHIRVVDSKVDLVALGLEETEGLGLGLANVGNKAASRVGYLLKLKICSKPVSRIQG